MIKRNVILVVVLAFCVVAAVFFLQGLARELREYDEAEQVYRLQSQPATDSAQTLPPCQAKLTDGSKRFAEQVAWIECDGTYIDYPVVHGKDNEFYLNHLADGTINPLGAIFLDAATPSDFSAPVSTIYGHRVANGQMFEGLAKYREQAYYDLNPTMWLCTDQAHYALDLIASYRVNGNETYPQAFQDVDEFTAFIQRVKNESFFESSVIPQFGERLIILSTCDYSFANARLSVVGRLRPAKHSDEKREDTK